MEDHLFLTKLDGSHNLIGREIEVFDHRTTCGTLLTLVAEKDVLPTFLANEFSKIGIQHYFHGWYPRQRQRALGMEHGVENFSLYALCSLLYAS
jgi:hypothetical protein